MEDAQTETVNPLHVMEDGEVLSRMILARDERRNDDFIKYRDEVMYRLRLRHIENWTPPLRLERKPTGEK